MSVAAGAVTSVLSAAWSSPSPTAAPTNRSGSPVPSRPAPVPRAAGHPAARPAPHVGPLALAAGIPAKAVQDRLGHSTIAITLNIYSHETPPMQADAAEEGADMAFGRRTD